MSQGDSAMAWPREAPVAVLGAGAWGTTLAWMLGSRGIAVRLWARRGELAEEIKRTRRNDRYRGEIEMPPQVSPTADIAEALKGARAVIVAVPSGYVREVLAIAAEHLAGEGPVILAMKGMEVGTGKRMSEVADEVLGARAAGRVAALSGPNLSEEIALGQPAAAVVASGDEACRQESQGLLASPLFRVYTNCDIVGVELCGSLKNVIALGAGISDGLGYGENTKATLVTRGLTEMARVVAWAGGDARSCWGLAGVGDVLATCHSRLSRNWGVGNAIGRGGSVEEAQAAVRGVAEGVYTCAALRDTVGGAVETPVNDGIYDILYHGEEPAKVAGRLMGRRWRDESETWPR
jgi:glycerol-3-phosphate dehydrogenase (NAD(P)+)